MVLDQSLFENGAPALTYSESAFKNIKKNTLIVQSNNPNIDKHINLYFNLLERFYESWTRVTMEILLLKLRNPSIKQVEIAAEVGKNSQGIVSWALNKAGYKSIVQLDQHFRSIYPGIKY